MAAPQSAEEIHLDPALEANSSSDPAVDHIVSSSASTTPTATNVNNESTHIPTTTNKSNFTPPPLPSPFSTTIPAPILLTQGAEALVYKTHWLAPTTQTSKDNAEYEQIILKHRPSKPYRHPTLDARLTKARVLSEARILVKLSSPTCREAGLYVPALRALEWDVARKVSRGKGAGTDAGSTPTATRTQPPPPGAPTVDVSGTKVQDGDDVGASPSASAATAAATSTSTSASTSTPAQTSNRDQASNSGSTPVTAQSGAWLALEFIPGHTVKQLLRECDAYLKRCAADGIEVDVRMDHEIKELMRRIGKAIGAMHSVGGVVHGDLTSSNLMVRPNRNTPIGQASVQDGQTKNGSTNGELLEENRKQGWPDLSGDIVLIDFGLATQVIQDEDRAVDLYVLERAFGSTHPKQEDWFDQEVLQSTDGYKGSFKGANVVLRRLEDVRLRGRKRSMLG